MTELILKETANSRVTVMDVASAAGVSYGVAADILREKTRYTYREETIARVQQTADKLSYRPSRVAQALTSGRTQQIALCVPSFGPSIVNKYVRAFDAAVRQTRYDLLVTSFQALQHQDITADGFIFYGWQRSIPAQMKLPMVLMGIQRDDLPPLRPTCDGIFLDLSDSCHEAMQHFLDQGCKRILYIASETMIHSHEPRYVAYADAMRRMNFPEEVVTFNIPYEENIREEVHYLLQKYFLTNGFPDALFCSNDDVAIGAYRALKEFGRQVPRETAILGCDDIEESKDISPTLTSIHFPYDVLCAKALEMLMERLQEANCPQKKQVYKSTLIVRESSCRVLPKNRRKGASHVHI